MKCLFDLKNAGAGTWIAALLMAALGGLATAGVCQTNSCAKGKSTTIGGVVYAPNGVDPLPNVLVYVPSGRVAPLAAGVSCESAEEQVSGAPVVSTLTAVDGSFTLENAPAGVKIPLVIQTGHWRRQVVIPNVAACEATRVAAALTRLPRTSAEGDIPKIAVVTGAVDGVECALRKIGIADAEFTDAGRAGRVNLFTGRGQPGAIIDTETPSENQLESSQKTLNGYDLVMFPCQGGQFAPSSAGQTKMIDYANAGGRVFATHFSYVWLYDDAPFSGAAQWDVDQLAEFTADPETAEVVETLSGGSVPWVTGKELADWLKGVGASTTVGQIPLGTLRKDQDGVTVGESQAWLTITDQHYTTPAVMQFSFDTPLEKPAASKCGRVIFNEYHVEDQTLSGETLFPKECSPGKMTAQEKLLEFSLFNLTGFVTPGQPPDLTIGFANQPAKLHQGDSDDSIKVEIADSGTVAASASLTAKIALPRGLSVKTIGGANSATGWKCAAATLTCTRTKALNGGVSDPILLAVSVAKNAPLSNAARLTATLTGGGLLDSDSANDSLTIAAAPAAAFTSSH